MTERELQKCLEPFAGLPQESREEAIARIMWEHDINETLVAERLHYLYEQESETDSDNDGKRISNQ